MYVRRYEIVLVLASILDQRLHVCRSLTSLIVWVRRTRLRELCGPGTAVAVECLCEDQFREVGFQKNPAQSLHLVPAVIAAAGVACLGDMPRGIADVPGAAGAPVRCSSLELPQTNALLA